MKTVIVCGSIINNYEFVSGYLCPDDFFIYCDSGLKHEVMLKKYAGDFAGAGLIVGDFDSYEKPERDVEIIGLPREKDDTDSVFAIKEAVRRGGKEIILIGALGNRIDHSLVNIYALKYLNDLGISGMIVDDYSENILISDGMMAHISDEWNYFSLLAICGDAKGVTIRGAKFPLEKGIINSNYQYATSNEVLSGQTAEVIVEKGCLLISRVKE